ncbi:Aspartate-tRNA ligase, cytoplasmic [Coccomyxa sp. Obi]|nr:Aspartate-tRNA ligase, cytoplasmic [Coccomyxa sp. Obi]
MWWDERIVASQPESDTVTPQEQPNGVSTAAADKGAPKPGKGGSKDAKAAKKAERASQRGKAAAPTQPDPDDPLRDNYGDPPLVQSRVQTGEKYSQISELSPALSGQKVVLRGRVHNVRGKGKSCFVVLRQQSGTVQAVLFVDDKTVSKGMVKYVSGIPKESIVDVSGEVHVPQEPIQGCTCSQVELKALSLKCISRAALLPFELSDAARKEEDLQREDAQFATVTQDTRLENRWIDLRTPVNQAIFRIQSAVCQLFREALLAEHFQEIHTPKLIAGASEGGAAVFKLDYMGREGCLAQSPQFYKQMAVCSDMSRVFEIGPVFRAEKSFTHRHLCEFTGLDLEMTINEHYNEVLDVLDRLFVYMFNGLKSRCAGDLATIQEQFPVEPLQYLPKTLRLPFEEGMKLLQEAGFEPDPLGDLTTELERNLGKIVKQKYNTDFYILYRYPLAVRPFYTMPDPEDSRYSNSFDVFIRGEEIISGAQRVHDAALLTERAQLHEIPLDSIQSYINAFKFGAPPHGGFGVGLERVVMLFCGLDNIRKTSLFPRDPKRLTP